MAILEKLNIRATVMVAVTTLIAVLLVLYIWRLPPFRTAIEQTENAYVRGSITIIAPKVDGYVAEVLVQDFMPVEAGQLLVRLDDRIFQQRLNQAQANLAVQEANLANVAQTRGVREAGISGSSAQIESALAQLSNAKAQRERVVADIRRAQSLVKGGFLSAQRNDQDEASLRQAEAAVAQAEAAILQSRAGNSSATQELRAVNVGRGAIEAAVVAARAVVKLAEIDLENARIISPVKGQVGEIGVKLGQYVVPGTQLLALVPAQVWVVANFKEAQTARMASGQVARIRVDALGDAEISGTVERIAPATGSEFSVIKQDNATGNFTKIAQRLPVRIAINPDQPLATRLRPGMSVVVKVDTGG